MLKEAMEYFQGQVEAKVFRIGGQDYTNRKLIMVTNPPIEPVVVSSLTGLVDYLKSGEAQALVALSADPEATNKYTSTRLFVQVVDCCRVVVMTGIGSDNTRDVVLRANHEQSSKFPFGSWISPEEFIVQLKINAVAPPDTWSAALPGIPVEGEPPAMSHYHQLLALASGIAVEHIATMKDDGITQSVATKQGINLDVTRILPFYELNFRRAFPEIYQARSTFFLRIRSRNDGKIIELALFECTRDDYEATTRSRVKDWLKEKLLTDDMVVLLD